MPREIKLLFYRLILLNNLLSDNDGFLTRTIIDNFINKNLDEDFTENPEIIKFMDIASPYPCISAK